MYPFVAFWVVQLEYLQRGKELRGWGWLNLFVYVRGVGVRGCMCVCKVWMSACVHECMCVCVHAQVRKNHFHVCMCACVHVCMCACVHVCMCACVHVQHHHKV